jgi:hypothetical protein
MLAGQGAREAAGPWLRIVLSQSAQLRGEFLLLV